MNHSRLLDSYDSLLLDLDGVLYVGDAAVPAAVDAMAAVRAWSGEVRFITNNASRTPDEVATKLLGLGIDAAADEVITSATCGAALLAGLVPIGSPVLVIGGVGIEIALEANGLVPVRSADQGPVAVLQGWAPTVDWGQLAEGAVAIANGARWVVTNLDATIPTERGSLPGNGSLVAALGHAVNRRPDTSVGKPESDMYLAARPGQSKSLAVGDRLDTDILGANRAGIDSMLVFTGVSTMEDVLRVGKDQRPTFVARDVAAVLATPPTVESASDCEWTCRGASAHVDGARLSLRGDRGQDGLDRVRAGLAAISAINLGDIDVAHIDL